MKYLIIIKEYFKELFDIITPYKCVAYVSDKDSIDKDKIVETFEIKASSERKAYETSFEILKLKYPGKGFDIRISRK